jgi:hypothetical protein
MHIEPKGRPMTRTGTLTLLIAAALQGCGSGGCEDCEQESLPTISAVQWHLGAPDSDLLAYSAGGAPDYVYLYVTVKRSDGSSTTDKAVGSCSSAQLCEFKPGDLLGVGPAVAYQVQLKGDLNAAHLSGNNVLPVPPPGAYQYAILLHIDQGNVPPFQPIVEVTTPGFAPVSWALSVSP